MIAREEPIIIQDGSGILEGTGTQIDYICSSSFRRYFRTLGNQLFLLFRIFEGLSKMFGEPFFWDPSMWPEAVVALLVPCSHSCRGIIWGQIGNPYSFSICSICSGKHSRITPPSALPSPLQILHLIDRLGALPRALSGRCPARRSSGPGGRTPRSPGESPSARPAARRQQCQGRRLWARTAPAANPASTSHCVASVCQSSAEVAVAEPRVATATGTGTTRLPWPKHAQSMPRPKHEQRGERLNWPWGLARP